MREARDWYFREFFPNSIADYNEAMMGQHSGHVRMVLSYWDMAAALVNHGAIDADLFNETNGEHISIFSRIEPILQEVRAAWGPNVYVNLEKLIDSMPNGRKRSAEMRERMKGLMAELKNRAKAAKNA